MRPSKHTAGLLFGELLERLLVLAALDVVLVLVVEPGPGVPVVVDPPLLEGAPHLLPDGLFVAFGGLCPRHLLPVGLVGGLHGAAAPQAEEDLGGHVRLVGLV